MIKKGGNFFEDHVEKFVLAVVGLVCVLLLATRIITSPNRVQYDGRKLTPSKIDYYISKDVDALEAELNKEAELRAPRDPCVGKFIAMMDCAIPNINVSVYWPLPIPISSNFIDNREYLVPEVGEIGEAVAEHIRAVAYVPTIEVDKDNIYDKDNSEPNDIDFVTVESRINVRQLVKNFDKSFAGEDVREDWRDPCLAKPVFAAVHLQRKELLADRDWSDWETVPRTKIDYRQKMFEIVEQVEDLPPGGIEVRLLNFDNKQVVIDLLQPEAYRIASSDEEWFPPSVHRKYVKYQKEVEAEEKRKAMEAQKKKREEEHERLRRERLGIGAETLSGTEGFSARDESRGMRYTRGARPPRGIRERGPGRRRGRPGTERDMDGEQAAIRRIRGTDTSKKKSDEKGKGALEAKSIKDFYDEYDKLLITEKTDIAKMKEPLVFWAHDDTIEPGKSYQYRVRLGVFNPIAGTEQVSEENESQKNKVILWSKFSDETKTVEIPARLYFFPYRMQEVAKIVTVKVCRYVLGYWYSDEFRVKQGEVIGKVKAVEAETVETDEQAVGLVRVTIPETVDYSTGALYVDALLVNNWAGARNMHSSPYYDMLYSFDGAGIEHMAISRSYWAQELQAKFGEIQELEKKPRKPLRDWGTKRAKERVTRREGEEFEEMDEEERERRAAERMRRE